MARNGVSWQSLPIESFGVSGSTCWRRLRDWTKAGVWPKLHRLLLGSDYPFTTPQQTMDALRAVNRMVENTNLPRIPEKAVEALIARDALDLLGIG